MDAGRATALQRRRPVDLFLRLLAIADDPSDEDDRRRRKHVAVLAGLTTLFGPLSLPIQAGGHPVSWVLALGLSGFSLANLIVLARTHRLERFVVALVAAGTLFVPMATVLGGGIVGSTTGLVWGFLIPAYAILALGWRRATPWFLVYLAVVGLLTIVDPLVRSAVGTPPYGAQLVAQVQNSVVPLTITFLLLRYTDARRLAAEARADELLTNAIPAAIAARLRRGERRIAESYRETTVLFADIVGFTPWARSTRPEDVVALLDGLFTTFDDLAQRHDVEKIKTIGDAYMAVAGAPRAREDHAAAAVELAQDMIRAVRAWRVRDGLRLEIRIGLASGPVVGGVIGHRRLLFDLWGDTVNLASRMESFGVPGRIQVSSSTRDVLGDRYVFQAREVEVKGLGRLTAYLID